MSPGEKARRQRARERKAIAFNAITEPLMLAGHSCADCKHFALMPFPDKRKHQCTLGQESGAYQVAYPNDICAQWNSK